MKLAQIWRYPVKSMGGEPLQKALVTPLGIEGDRVVHAEDNRGHVVTSRTYPDLLGLHAKLGPAGEPLVDGLPWRDPAVRRKVVEIIGPGARVVHDESESRFDVLPLLVATDGAIAAFGHDGRRLRPNLVISGVEGLDERSWPGRCLRIGNVVIGVEDLRGRCIMTTFDPDTLEQNRNVLREIVQKFGGKIALNCYVIAGGEIEVGDDVELSEQGECEAIDASSRGFPTGAGLVSCDENPRTGNRKGVSFASVLRGWAGALALMARLSQFRRLACAIRNRSS